MTALLAVAVLWIANLCAQVAPHTTMAAMLNQGAQPQPTTQPQLPASPRELSVTVGKSTILESPVTIERVSVGNSDVAEAVVVSPREVLINARTPGETTLVV